MRRPAVKSVERLFPGPEGFFGVLVVTLACSHSFPAAVSRKTLIYRFGILFCPGCAGIEV